MTSDATTARAHPGRRHSTGVVILAALAGLAFGALAVFAVTGVTWKIRVELPQPLYPSQLSPTPPASYPSTPLSAPAAVPTPPSSGIPVPALPHP
jgi:hypothetical protein